MGKLVIHGSPDGEKNNGEFDELLTTQIVAGYCEILMDCGMYADLMTEIPGLSKEEFDKQYELAVKDEVNSVPIRFIHYNHLIQNKKATGLPNDSFNVQELEK
jgi:hypothetical protein